MLHDPSRYTPRPLAGETRLRPEDRAKISASPWCRSARPVAKAGADYVISHKPNPAVFAADTWHPEWARR